MAIVNHLPVWSAPTLTVTGYDPLRDTAGSPRIGGDTINVCSAADPTRTLPIPACGAVIAGPSSPLVVYGDTSQDGTWYAGHPYDTLGYEFGPKPFDPFTYIPDAENEDDEWVFGLADPYTVGRQRHHRRAQPVRGPALHHAHLRRLPTVGFTAYGGIGDDLLIGSQTGDFLAGGSGDDEIRGLRGADQIYGDSGVNVDVLTRRLTIDTVNASPLPTITGAGFLNNGTTIEPYPSPARDFMLVAGRDLIFGDGPGTVGIGHPGHPAAATTTSCSATTAPSSRTSSTRTSPTPGCRRSRPPAGRRSAVDEPTGDTLRGIESRTLQNGDDDIIFGGDGRDVLVGGDGNDMADGGNQDDFVFGDNMIMTRTIGDWTSPHFQTLCGTLLYSRTDRPAACGYPATGPGSLSQDNSGLLLVDGIPRAYRDPDGAPWWAEYNVTEPVPRPRVRPGHQVGRQLRQRLPRRWRAPRRDPRPARRRRDPGRRQHLRRAFARILDRRRDRRPSTSGSPSTSVPRGPRPAASAPSAAWSATTSARSPP